MLPRIFGLFTAVLSTLFATLALFVAANQVTRIVQHLPPEPKGLEGLFMLCIFLVAVTLHPQLLKRAIQFGVIAFAIALGVIFCFSVQSIFVKEGIVLCSALTLGVVNFSTPFRKYAEA